MQKHPGYILVTDATRNYGTENVSRSLSNLLGSSDFHTEFLVVGVYNNKLQRANNHLGPLGLFVNVACCFLCLLNISILIQIKALISRKRLKKPVIITTFHQASVLASLLRPLGLYKLVVWEHLPLLSKTRSSRLMATTFRLSDKLVVLTKRDKETYPGFMRPQIVVIPNFIRSTPVNPSINTVSIPDLDKKIVIFAARLCYQKGTDYWPDIIERVVASNSQVTFQIIGGGPMMKSLKEEIDKRKLNKHVVILGELSHIDCVKFLSRGSLFALPSRYEAYPMVMLESILLNVPIVASDCHTGPREILSESKYIGKIVQLSSSFIPNFSDAILHMLDVTQSKEYALESRREFDELLYKHSPKLAKTSWKNLLEGVIL